MTGYDLQFWLENIWFDLSNFGQADVISLVFRLIMLAVVAYFLYGVIDLIVRTLSRCITQSWRVLMIPFSIPKRRYQAWQRRKADRENQREYEQSRREQAERRRIDDEEQAVRRQEEQEAIRKALELE